MRLYLVKKAEGIKAEADNNVETNEIIVIKGSQVSTKTSNSSSFKGLKSLEAQREKYVKNGKVKENVSFKSPSSISQEKAGPPDP